MTTLRVFFKKYFAGHLKKTSPTHYEFQYDASYLAREDARQISVNLPLQSAPFISTKFFPFFDNLIAEGWLLDIQTREKKLTKEDRFELIKEFGIECMGAVSLRGEDE